jgi:hypothetical protein
MARRRIAGNYFESEETISGAVLKGALATILAQDQTGFPLLRKHLWAIRFSHAFPNDDSGSRPQREPESLFLHQGQLYDALRKTEAELLAFEDAIQFSVDWKRPQDHRKWKAVDKELRVRTAIHSENRRAADAELFAYEMLVTEDRTWIGSATLPAVEGLAQEFLTAIQHGLFGIGKTKAFAKVDPKEERFVGPTFGDSVAITLQTSALICDPSRHLAPGGSNGSSDAELMEREYRDAWSEMSEGSLELENYYHRCSLAGSEYLRRRFQTGLPYRPYLLTDPGSVFLLKVKDMDRAKRFLDDAAANGLRLSPSVRRFYELQNVPDSELWKRCPFLPENGYGEVALNLEVPHVSR